MDSNNGGNVDDLHTDPLDLARHFTGSGVRLPVEIVEANGESVVLQRGRDNPDGGQGESIEISVEEMPSSDGGNHDNCSVGLGDGTTTDQTLPQQFQEVSRSLRSEGIEISPETIASHFLPSLAETLAASIINQTSSATSTTLLDSGSQGLQIGGISYSDLADVTRVMNATLDPSLTASSSGPIPSTTVNSDMITSVFTESDVMPSSPESNFDTNELLNADLGHDEEVASKLANAGPVGVAAAAAIMSGRKRKRHLFESNPALRKRHCSKLLRRLKETLEELSTRVGLQACVVTYRPSSKQEKPDASYKVFGSSPLRNCLEDQRGRVLAQMDTHLKKHIPQNTTKQIMFDLPPLVFEGIPTPVQEMTQAQLRAFIPHMLKYSTGRGKPGWGKEEMRPIWWPQEVPWQNIRSDARDDGQKKSLTWSDCLRKIVLSCYLHHNRADLLPSSLNVEKENSLELVQSDDPAQQLQLLQQQHGLDLTSLQTVGQESGSGGIGSLGDITASQVDQSLLSDQQQVFTIDTGMGNCDTSGMPTLADASLAETATRLQQVADETGQVQYATQTVTVTENDAKALGQPVGSTTTVLLTAYPSHGGSGGSDAANNMDTQQSFFSSKPDGIGSPPTTASATSSAPSYSVWSCEGVNPLDSLTSTSITPTGQ